MVFNMTSERVSKKFSPSTIQSNERMTYTAVRQILDDREPVARNRYASLINDFELMGELCNILRERRLKRGSLDFDLPEPEVLLDIKGNPKEIIRAERNFAHMIIEEFMISANEAVAEHLEGLETPNIYRVHEEPDPMKLDGIISVIATLGLMSQRNALKMKDFSALLTKVKGSDVEEC